MAKKAALTLDYERLAWPTGKKWKTLPLQKKLRQLVIAQTKLISAHNVQGQSMPLAEFRAKQRNHWNPRLMLVGTEIAHRRKNLPAPVDPEAVRYDRGAVRATLTAGELSAIKLSDVLLGEVDAQPLPDPLQDFTTFTEVDPNSRYAIAANVITVTGLTRNEAAYIYKDFGTGHFTDFTHDVGPFQYTSTGGTYGVVAFWAVSQALDDVNGWNEANEKAIYVSGIQGTGIYAREFEGDSADSWGGAAQSTDYWFVIVKSGTGISVNAYSDPAKTSLEDTLTMTLGTDRAYPYLFGVNSHDSTSTDKTVNASIANLDIHEGRNRLPLLGAR